MNRLTAAFLLVAAAVAFWLWTQQGESADPFAEASHLPANTRLFIALRSLDHLGRVSHHLRLPAIPATLAELMCIVPDDEMSVSAAGLDGATPLYFAKFSGDPFEGPDKVIISFPVKDPDLVMRWVTDCLDDHPMIRSESRPEQWLLYSQEDRELAAGALVLLENTLLASISEPTEEQKRRRQHASAMDVLARRSKTPGQAYARRYSIAELTELCPKAWLVVGVATTKAGLDIAFAIDETAPTVIRLYELGANWSYSRSITVDLVARDPWLEQVLQPIDAVIKR